MNAWKGNGPAAHVARIRPWRRCLQCLSALFLLAAFGATARATEETGIQGTVGATPAKYLSDTIVYVKTAKGPFPARTVDMDQKGMEFIPHLLLITKGDTVRFLNHDSVAHNVFSPDHGTYDLGTFSRGQTRSHAFSDSTGVYTQLCSLHPEMVAYIFVGQNPYASLVDASGRYSIRGVPAGKYTLAVWNPHLKAPEQSVTVMAGHMASVGFSLHR